MVAHFVVAELSSPDVLATILYYVGRPSKYTADEILDAAAALIRDGGPGALTISAVAQRLSAPSGSIYHRFASRDLLAASLWLRAVARFQDGALIALANDDPRAAVRDTAAYVLMWSRNNLDDAVLLLLYRSSDLVGNDWPPELTRRNQQLRKQLNRALTGLNDRLGAVSKADRRRVAFAVMDIPYGAVREPLRRGVAPEPELDTIVDDAVTATIDGIASRR